MSWVAGCLTIENESQKEINRAKTHIRNVVRNNADLGEFPNMGDSLNRIKFVNPDTIPSSIEEAERIADGYNWRRNYNIAIPFVGESKKMKDIRERIEEEQRKYEEYGKKHSVLTFKAAYVSCPKCMSKLNKEYLKTDKCPVCRSDMRSDTTKATLERYQKKIASLKKEYEEQKKIPKNKKYVLFYEEYIG